MTTFRQKPVALEDEPQETPDKPKREPSHWPRDFDAVNRPDPKAKKQQENDDGR